MPTMEITIQNRTFNIRNFYFDYTYSSLLAGKPGREINEEILGRLNKPERSWGFKMYKSPISDDQMNNALPACYFYADVSSAPINSDFCESGLTLFWLDAPPFEKSIPKIMEEILQQVNWEIDAEDFDF